MITQTSKPALQVSAQGFGTSTGIHGQSRVDLFYVANLTGKSVVMYQAPASANYGFVAEQSSSMTPSTSNFGSPALYANNALATSTTWGDVYTATNGNKIVSYQAGSTSVWTAVDFLSYGSGYDSTGKMQELIIFASDQSANRSSSTTAINSYWGVY